VRNGEKPDLSLNIIRKHLREEEVADGSLNFNFLWEPAEGILHKGVGYKENAWLKGV